ncbi:TetR family transcriptional regulator [Streptomyces sp. NPDC055681]
MPRVAEARRPAAPPPYARPSAGTAFWTPRPSWNRGPGTSRCRWRVAKAADVAVGTLYRYFPSKQHLFTSAYARRVARFTGARWPETGDADTHLVEAVGERLTDLTSHLLEQPVLCASMVRAASATHCAPSEPLVDSQLCRAILHILGAHEPGEERTAEVQMLVYSWWGVLVSVLSGRTSHAEAAYQITLSARRLLARGVPPT